MFIRKCLKVWLLRADIGNPDTENYFHFMAAAHLRLVWNNPEEPLGGASDPGVLRMLGDVLAGSVRCGFTDVARELANSHALSPLAVAVVSRQMQNYGLSQEDIRKVV